MSIEMSCSALQNAWDASTASGGSAPTTGGIRILATQISTGVVSITGTAGVIINGIPGTFNIPLSPQPGIVGDAAILTTTITGAIKQNASPVAGILSIYIQLGDGASGISLNPLGYISVPAVANASIPYTFTGSFLLSPTTMPDFNWNSVSLSVYGYQTTSSTTMSVVQPSVIIFNQ